MVFKAIESQAVGARCIPTNHHYNISNGSSTTKSLAILGNSGQADIIATSSDCKMEGIWDSGAVSAFYDLGILWPQHSMGPSLEMESFVVFVS